MNEAPDGPTRAAPSHQLLSPGLPLGLVCTDPGGGHIFDRFASEIDVTRHLVEFLGIDLIGLGDLIGDRPFLLHAAPGVFPDFAMRLAAVMRLRSEERRVGKEYR